MMSRLTSPNFAQLLYALVAVMLLASHARADTTYSFNIYSDFPTGTITTDGNSGVLSAADIVSWDLGPVRGGFPDLTSGSSTLTLVGSALTATATQLTFDFGTSSPGYMAFSSYVPGSLNNQEAVSFCSADLTTCLDQNGNQAQFSLSQIFSSWAAPGCCSSGNNHPESGAQVIATSSGPSLVPEPAMVPILLMAIGLTGCLSPRRPRRSPDRHPGERISHPTN